MTDEKKHIVFMSDMDTHGSGYRNLSTRFCDGLVEHGYDVKVIGLHYEGQEHFGKYSLIPSDGFQDAMLILTNLVNLWKVDCFIVALDIPLQEQVLMMLGQKPFKYIGIMPLEAPPLCLTWAMSLTMMDAACFISKFGTEEAKKVGVFNAHYLEIGIDTDFWKPISKEEISHVKNTLGLSDSFNILTVADNQERKNLVATMDAVSKLVVANPDKKIRYVLVTRENNLVGWKLRDYAKEIGISDNISIFERGIELTDLRAIYACSDVFVLSSKAEGLGLPLLEAMAMEIPCIATNAAGMAELLSDGRGTLIDPEYIHRDPFGNGMRYWINKFKLQRAIQEIIDGHVDAASLDAAKKFVESRSWLIGQNMLADIVSEVLNGKE